MKLSRLLVLSTSMFLLMGCTGGNTADGGNTSSSEQEAPIESISEGDYYHADAFEPENAAYAETAAAYTSPSIRFLAGGKYDFVMHLNYNSQKYKCLYTGTYTFSDGALTLSEKQVRVNGAISASNNAIIHASVRGSKIYVSFGMDTGSGEMTMGHALLAKTAFTPYSIEFEGTKYRFSQIEEQSSMTEDEIATATAIYGNTEAVVASDKIVYTSFERDMFIEQISTSFSSSAMTITQQKYRDYDGTLLYTYTPSHNTVYHQSPDTNTFKILPASSSKFAVVYTK
jgi:hypothetical protein